MLKGSIFAESTLFFFILCIIILYSFSIIVDAIAFLLANLLIWPISHMKLRTLLFSVCSKYTQFPLLDDSLCGLCIVSVLKYCFISSSKLSVGRVSEFSIQKC